MKSKKFYVLAIICAILFVSIFATACIPDGCLMPSLKSSEYIKNCDFSFSNVSELVVKFGCPISTCSIKKGQSEEGDEDILQALEYWKTFQSQVVFNDDIYGEDHAIVGATTKFICIFQDGSSIELGLDGCRNFVINDFGPCQVENYDVYKEFTDISDIILKSKYLTDYYGDVPPYLPID